MKKRWPDHSIYPQVSGTYAHNSSFDNESSYTFESLIRHLIEIKYEATLIMDIKKIHRYIYR